MKAAPSGAAFVLWHRFLEQGSRLRARLSGGKLADVDTFTLNIGQARADEAGDIARIYIESWHDAYPGVLPDALLRAM
ncbi:MAG TPA: hypothetical protein VGM36_11890, partial [Rhizomicrobium sp.]